jgi:hypothetical protein
MPNPDPETLYYTQEDNGECLYKIAYRNARIVLSRGVRSTDLMVAMQLSRLTSNPMGSARTHLDKNEARDNRVSLTLHKRKASYTLKSGEGSMTTRGQILTGTHYRFCMCIH